MTNPKWSITIPRWNTFQHYKHRDPIWLRLYTRLHSNDDYLDLTTHLRGVLLGLWIEYARSGCDLTVTTATLSRRLNAKVTTADLQRLNQAGFIEITLATRKQPAPLEESRAEEKSLPRAVVVGAAERPTTFEHFLREAS